MTFLQTVLAETAPLCAAIRTMPFNRALADGTLPHEVFQNYIIQDARYLEGFARALSLASARAPDAATVGLLSGAAAATLREECRLHEHYMTFYGVTAERFAATAPSPACDHYTSFLIATAATRSTAEAMAALLPCYWVYRDVGKVVSARARPDNPYQAWINTYVSEEFESAVVRSCALAEDLHADASERIRKEMRALFAKSTLMEWEFWDSAWHRRDWQRPV